MGDRGTPRKGKGRTHRPKKPEVCAPRAPGEAASAAERYLALIGKAESYLEGELERVVKEEGNSAEAIRLRKHFQERLAEANSQAVGDGSEAGGTPRQNPHGWLESGVDGEGEEPQAGSDSSGEPIHVD